MTALLVKKYANDENTMQVYYSFLNHNYHKFMDSYKIWEQVTKLPNDLFSIEQICSHFNELFGDAAQNKHYYIADTETDFNYIVDYIF